MRHTKQGMDYLTWNEIITRHFFTAEKAGKEVLLYVNEPLIARLGEPFRAELADFVQAAKKGPAWTTRSGFCQKALQTFEGWRSRGFDCPPYVAYLAFFVLAAGREGDFAVHAYYPRLRELLGEPGETRVPASFDKMIDLWDDLEKWSKEDKHETLGRFEARIRGGWWKVGLPLSQTLISEDERKHLPVLFSRESLDPSDIPSPEVILRILRLSGSTLLERRTLRLLSSDNPDRDDTVLRSALVNLVTDELEEWDGTVTGAGETGDERHTRQIRTGLRICLTFDLFANTVSCRVRIKSARIFPEDGLNFVRDSDSHCWSCSELSQGWSKVLRDHNSEPPATLDGAVLDWTGGERFADVENQWQALLRKATTRLFIPGKYEGLPDWIERQRLERNVEFLIASCRGDLNKIRAWGNTNCAEFQEHQVSGLPTGWVLFSGRSAQAPCPGIDVLEVSSSIRLLIRGGIKSSTGNAYLKFAPPYIVVDNGLGAEKVTLNDRELDREGEVGQLWHLPDDAPIGESLRVEVRSNGEVLRRVLRLEEPELPPRASYRKCGRNAAGDLCYGQIPQHASGGVVHFPPETNVPTYSGELPLNLSSRIVFVGERPGEICDWPTEALPSWSPVWAIARISRKRARLIFCGSTDQVNRNHSRPIPLPDRKLVKKWKEATWFRRKSIIWPELGRLSDLWREYLEVARNV